VPKVLVAIPTLNRPEFVRQAVQSVRSQSFADWRIQLSDNASRPEAAADVQAWVHRLADPRIAYTLQPKNIREYGNCCWLFEQCTDEEFFVVLHDDDLLEPTHLARAVERLQANPGLVAFCANAKQIDGKGEISVERTAAYRRARGRDGLASGPIDMLEPLMKTGFVPISGTVFRSAALRAAGFVDDDCFGLWPFELNMLLRLTERDGRAWFEREELVRFRFHDGQMQRYQGISADPVAIAMVLQLLERRHYAGQAEKVRRWMASMFYSLQARIAVRRGDMAGCRRSLARGIRLNPWWLRHWPLAACAFLVPPLAATLVRRIDALPPREL
jgi:glycosyltransferase involved in cell wall biosynthesis